MQWLVEILYRFRRICPEVDVDLRMVGKGLGISMMSEFMIRGNTDDVCCIPVTPECIRELGMGMKKETEPSDSIKKLKDCVLEYVGELKKRKKP